MKYFRLCLGILFGSGSGSLKAYNRNKSHRASVLLALVPGDGLKWSPESQMFREGVVAEFQVASCVFGPRIYVDVLDPKILAQISSTQVILLPENALGTLGPQQLRCLFNPFLNHHPFALLPSSAVCVLKAFIHTRTCSLFWEEKL